MQMSPKSKFHQNTQISKTQKHKLEINRHGYANITNMQMLPQENVTKIKMASKWKFTKMKVSSKIQFHQNANVTNMPQPIFLYIELAWIECQTKKSFPIADNIHLFIYWSKYCLQKKQADEKEFLNIKRKFTWFIGKFDSRNIHPCQKILSGERTINFFFNSQFPSNPHVQLFFE